MCPVCLDIWPREIAKDDQADQAIPEIENELTERCTSRKRPSGRGDADAGGVAGDIGPAVGRPMLSEGMKLHLYGAFTE